MVYARHPFTSPIKNALRSVFWNFLVMMILMPNSHILTTKRSPIVQDGRCTWPGSSMAWIIVFWTDTLWIQFSLWCPIKKVKSLLSILHLLKHDCISFCSFFAHSDPLDTQLFNPVLYLTPSCFNLCMHTPPLFLSLSLSLQNFPSCF